MWSSQQPMLAASEESRLPALMQRLSTHAESDNGLIGADPGLRCVLIHRVWLVCCCFGADWSAQVRLPAHQPKPRPKGPQRRLQEARDSPRERLPVIGSQRGQAMAALSISTKPMCQCEANELPRSRGSVRASRFISPW